jgi:hypothetical protein
VVDHRAVVRNAIACASVVSSSGTHQPIVHVDIRLCRRVQPACRRGCRRARRAWSHVGSRSRACRWSHPRAARCLRRLRWRWSRHRG